MNMEQKPGKLTTKRPGPPASVSFPRDVELWHDDEYIGLMSEWIANEIIRRWDYVTNHEGESPDLSRG
jgi:hypothetical protein